MAVTYGAESGRLAVGIDTWYSPSSVTKDTASVTIYWDIYSRTTYGWNDNHLYTLSNAISATKWFLQQNSTEGTTTKYIGRWSQTVTLSYTSTQSKTLVVKVTDLFNGGTPQHSRTISIPKRPPQLPSAATSASVTVIGASSARVDWTRPSNASSASNIWTNVHVMRSVNGGAYETVQTLAGTATTWTDNSLTANNIYRYRVWASNVSGYSGLVYTTSIQTELPAPTSVTPASGSTVTKPNPTLGATLGAIAGGITSKAQWQFATDANFTQNVQTVTELDSDLRTSGATTEAPSILNLALTNGTWYIRAQAIDANGNAGPFSASHSFTVNTAAPTAATGVTPASGATVTTMQPTLGATLSSDAAGRQVKAQWQLATNNTFTSNVRDIVELDSDFRTSGSTTEVVPLAQRISPDLGTTWWVRARKVTNDGAVSSWTSGTSFTLSLTAPPIPTGVTPATGGVTQLTNTPTLGATVVAATEGRLSKIQWQLATDAGFSSNVRTITEPDENLRTSGARTYQIPPADKLFQGTWYIRARQIDEFGSTGSYSSSQTFTIAHAPVAVPISPRNSFVVQYGATTPFDWTFTDTSSTDTQSAYQIVVERNDTGALVVDTGKVTSVAENGSAAIGSGFKDILLRWKVRLWDNDNVQGNYSGYNLFMVSDAPVVTITSPTSGQQLTTGQPTFTWTTDGATNQVAYRIIVTRVDDGVVVYDTGTVASSLKTNTAPTIILQNEVDYTVTITVTDVHGLETSQSVNFSTSYSAPDSVLFGINSDNYDTDGYILLDWSQMTPDAFFIDWRVYRRMPLENEWTEIYITNDPTRQYFKDWSAASGDEYEYTVTQTAGRFGAVIESPKVYTETRPAEGTHYWLINPYNDEDNLRLSNVTSDSYTDEYEEEELQIIGRGRKVNHGTRFGYNGSLVAQLRDDELGTARAKRVKLQQLKAARVAYQLRNPFGDFLQVSLGNLQVSRVAGVGSAEFVDVTVPYKEVM